jgi:hypothetical protein
VTGSCIPVAWGVVAYDRISSSDKRRWRFKSHKLFEESRFIFHTSKQFIVTIIPSRKEKE